MAALISLFFNNPYLMAAVASAVGALVFYWKGYSQAKKQANLAQQRAELLQAQNIQKTEAQNQVIDSEREANAETVNSTNTIPQLISLWSKISGQTSSNPTDKKS